MFKFILMMAGASMAADWDYKKNGADWSSLKIDNNMCGIGKQ
jgi:carbonic anhydrase